MPSELLTPVWDARIVGIAKSVSRNYNNPLIDPEDVAQELRLWFLTSKAVPRYLEDGGKDAMLRLSLRNHAIRVCQREDQASGNPSQEDACLYSSKQIAALLPIMFDPETWASSSQGLDDMPTAKVDPAHGNTRLAELVDIKTAYGLLPDRDQLLLEHLFRFGYELQEIADQEGVPLDTVRRRMYRAVTRMRKRLGGITKVDVTAYDGPGSRRVITNSAAQAQTGY